MLIERIIAYRITAGISALAAVVIGIAAFASGGRATVTGRVMMQGRPVIWGSVMLIGSNGVAAAGRIEPDGSFTVPNAPTGDVTITVSSPDPMVDYYKTQIKSMRVAVPVSQWPAPPVDRNQWFLIPKRYENPATSDLKLTVKRGTPACEIDLVP